MKNGACKRKERYLTFSSNGFTFKNKLNVAYYSTP